MPEFVLDALIGGFDCKKNGVTNPLVRTAETHRFRQDLIDLSETQLRVSNPTARALLVFSLSKEEIVRR